MGFFKKAFRPVRKIAKKIIPKEIRPALPFIASAYFGPSTGGLGNLFTRESAKLLAQKAAIAAGTAAATDEDANLARVAALSIAPDVLGSASESAAGLDFFKNNPKTISALEKTAGFLRPESGVNFDQAKLIGSQTAIDQSAKFAEIRQDEIDEYNRSLREQGVLDKTKRRTAIFNIYKNAGYDDDYVNSMLDRYGYAEGGITRGLMSGRKGRSMRNVMTMDELLKRTPVVSEEEEKDPIIEIEEGEEVKVDDKGGSIIRSKKDPDFVEAMMAAKSGVEAAFGIPFAGVEAAEFKRFAKGGEVEEEVEESGIMIASSPNNFAELNMLAIDLFGRPYDQLSDSEQEALMDFIGSKSQADSEGIMQMASGYKDDIDEMYEQYVFEMEEMGLEPMSFSQFLARERAGMKDGGITFEEYLKGRGKEEKRNTREKLLNDYEEFKRRRKVQEQRQEVKDGGIMEKDMRGGGFIPEGTKERADDVPARLSKNEFVMTADAVRAAGGGSVNKGAKRMYDMMYSLEGKV